MTNKVFVCFKEYSDPVLTGEMNSTTEALTENTLLTMFFLKLPKSNSTVDAICSKLPLPSNVDIYINNKDDKIFTYYHKCSEYYYFINQLKTAI